MYSPEILSNVMSKKQCQALTMYRIAMKRFVWDYALTSMAKGYHGCWYGSQYFPSVFDKGLQSMAQLKD